MKYELTDETTVFRRFGLVHTCFRIRALYSFADVKEGDLGGWVEKYVNLSQYGNAWVYEGGAAYGSGLVIGNATLRDGACVRDHALARDNAKIVSATLSGSAFAGRDAYVRHTDLEHSMAVSGRATQRPAYLYGIRYPVTIADDLITIGCQHHSLQQWTAFDFRAIAEMDGRNAVRFWEQYRDIILSLAAVHQARIAPLLEEVVV